MCLTVMNTLLSLTTTSINLCCIHTHTPTNTHTNTHTHTKTHKHMQAPWGCFIAPASRPTPTLSVWLPRLQKPMRESSCAATSPSFPRRRPPLTETCALSQSSTMGQRSKTAQLTWSSRVQRLSPVSSVGWTGNAMCHVRKRGENLIDHNYEKKD